MPFVRQLIQETINAGNLEDAFYVFNVDDVIAKHQNWLRKMPRIRPFYAVKCNNTAVVLESLAALGIGFDCASKAEIDSVLDMGVHPGSIIYANPCKTRSALSHAARVAVDMMTFDNEDELYKIHQLFPDARLVLRIKVDDSHAKYHLSKKFGASMDSVPRLMQLAQSLALNIVGISFHVGSGGDSADPYRQAIADAKDAFDYGHALGFRMNLLDIGGGFPGSSGEQSRRLFDKIAATVSESLDLHFPVDGPAVSVIAEPGRYYVESAFTLTALIVSKRRDHEDGEEVINYFLNDGMYGSFSNTTFAVGEAIPVPEISQGKALADRSVKASTIWGPTCDSLDILHQRIFLPEMSVGEWMTFTDMGAYTMCLGTKFNGFTMPILKCHASCSSIDVLMKTGNWMRLLVLMGLDDESARSMSKESLAYQIWTYIHVLH